MQPSERNGQRRWPGGTLLGALDPRDLDALCARGTSRTFRPGETLIIEGDSGKDVFLLLDGWVKAVGNSIDGHEVLLSIRTGGDAVGELAALDNAPRSASVVAVTQVSVCLVPQGHFLGVIESRPGAAMALSRSVAAKMRLMTRHRIEVSGAPVLRRVTRVLEYLMESYATPCPEGLRIDVPLSRAELAGLAGAAQPSLYRALAYLRDRKVLVIRNRRHIIRDPGLLEKIAQDADPDARRAGLDHPKN